MDKLIGVFWFVANAILALLTAWIIFFEKDLPAIMYVSAIVMLPTTIWMLKNIIGNKDKNQKNQTN